MRYPNLAKHADAAAFRAHLQECDPALDCVEALQGPTSALARPLEVHGLEIGNRWCIHPMEGWDGQADGLPSEHTLRRWRRFGRSGAKLIWGGEAFAVRADGRANPNQLFLNDEVDVLGGLRALREELLAGHAEQGLEADDLLDGLQLTHSGRWSRPTAGGAAPRTASEHPLLDARLGVGAEAVLSDDELQEIRDRYVRAARLAQEAGFRFVDVKACHGYLLHEMLGAKQRPGRYGGSFENRTRLFREIVEAVRAACPGLIVVTRVSITDLFPFRAAPADGVGEPDGLEAQLPWRHGFGMDESNPLEPDFEEPFAFLALLEELDIRLVNVSIGSPYYCPHVQRPATFPPSDGYLPPADPLRGVAFHLRTVRAVKARFPDLHFVGTGYTYLQDWLPHVAEHEVGAGHVDFVGLGRMVLAYPELPLDHLQGKGFDHKRCCRTFSDCTTGPRNGMISGCFPLDPYYRAMDEAKQVRALRPKPV